MTACRLTVVYANVKRWRRGSLLTVYRVEMATGSVQWWFVRRVRETEVNTLLRAQQYIYSTKQAEVTVCGHATLREARAAFAELLLEAATREREACLAAIEAVRPDIACGEDDGINMAVAAIRARELDAISK